MCQRPITTKEDASLLQSQRKHEQMRERVFEDQQNDLDKSMALELAEQNKILQRLLDMRKVSKSLAK